MSVVSENTCILLEHTYIPTAESLSHNDTYIACATKPGSMPHALCVCKVNFGFRSHTHTQLSRYACVCVQNRATMQQRHLGAQKPGRSSRKTKFSIHHIPHHMPENQKLRERERERDRERDRDRETERRRDGETERNERERDERDERERERARERGRERESKKEAQRCPYFTVETWTPGGSKFRPLGVEVSTPAGPKVDPKSQEFGKLSFGYRSKITRSK